MLMVIFRRTISAIHRGIFLPAGKQRRWPNDHDGHRSGPSEAIQHINYELRKDIKKLSKEELERANIPIWPCRGEVENTALIIPSRLEADGHKLSYDRGGSAGLFPSKLT